MSLTNTEINVPPSGPRLSIAMERLGLMQSELVSEALKRAIDDAGAAMAHELNGPLTALLLYLHDMKQIGERGDSQTSLNQMVDLALREAERVCNIIGRVVPATDVPINTDAAITRGSAAIDAWARNKQVKAVEPAAPARPRTSRHPLTPRELEVLALIVGGSSNKGGGYLLGISTRTFEAHRANVMAKTGARNAADLIRKTANLDQ